MTATQTQKKLTYLAAAEAALAAAAEEVARVEKDVAPVLDKCAEAQLALDELNNTAPNGPAAKQARATIAALGPQVIAARRRLELVQRRRSAAAERVTSEKLAIADLQQCIATQEQREARQAAVIDDTERQLREQRVALDVERQALRHLREKLAALTGEDG